LEVWVQNYFRFGVPSPHNIPQLPLPIFPDPNHTSSPLPFPPLPPHPSNPRGK